MERICISVWFEQLKPHLHPTSLGDYTIELRRDDATACWGVTRFQPPA